MNLNEYKNILISIDKKFLDPNKNLREKMNFIERNKSIITQEMLENTKSIGNINSETRQKFESLKEKFEMFWYRPKEFLSGKEITLYRGEVEPKKDIIKPSFANPGTKFGRNRVSSFWSPNKNISLSYLLPRPSEKDIEKYLGINKELEDEIKRKYKEKYNDEIARVYRTVRDNGLIYFLIENENKKREFINFLKKLKTDGWLYEVKIKLNDKDLGIGWNPNLDEYTIDREIKPDKITHVTKITDDIIESLYRFVKIDEFVDEIYKHEQNSEGRMSKREKKSKIDYAESHKNIRYYAFNKSGLGKEIFIDYINSNKKDVLFLSDLHLKDDDEDYLNKIIEKCKNEIGNKKIDFIVFLGDIIDKSVSKEKSEKILLNFSKKLGGHFGNNLYVPIIYIIGNSEISNINQEIGYRGISSITEIIETRDYVFSHAPVSTEKRNIHGHLHGIKKYWGIDPKNHYDILESGKQWIMMKDIPESGFSGEGKTRFDAPLKNMGKPLQILLKKYGKEFRLNK